MSRTATKSRQSSSATTTRRAPSSRRSPAPKRRPIPTPAPTKRVIKARTSKRRTMPIWYSQLTSAVFQVLFVTFLVFITSSIVGNALLESARKERIQLQERASWATNEISMIRRSVDESTNLREIEKFATSLGMVRSGHQVVPQTLVAGSAKISDSPTSQVPGETIFANAR